MQPVTVSQLQWSPLRWADHGRLDGRGLKPQHQVGMCLFTAYSTHLVVKLMLFVSHSTHHCHNLKTSAAVFFHWIVTSFNHGSITGKVHSFTVSVSILLCCVSNVVIGLLQLSVLWLKTSAFSADQHQGKDGCLLVSVFTSPVQSGLRFHCLGHTGYQQLLKSFTKIRWNLKFLLRL